ncbi:MAG: hypothetical protein D6729_04970, partial [Deltaproteobacteria bacterium]
SGPGQDAALQTIARLPGRADVGMAGTVGQGRVVIYGDSSAGSDGTGGSVSDGDAWHDPSQQNAAFFLNAVSWLAGETE